MSVDATPLGGSASRMACTRHELPDGGWHFDWFIERPGVPAEHRLRTFRVMRDPATAEVGDPFDAESIPDHRVMYLDYSGPVSGGRGSVLLRWSVPCRVLQLDDQRIAVRAGVNGRLVALDGSPSDGVIWRFVRTDAGPCGG